LFIGTAPSPPSFLVNAAIVSLCESTFMSERD
jgi:hypothetical protein